MPPDDVESAVDELYALAPETFTAGRDALVKELRPTDKARAAEVKALRKPTVAAWAVNQSVRRRPDLVKALEEAAAAVRSAQRALLSGRGASAVRDATTARRRAVADLTDAAAEALAAGGRAVSDTIREAVSNTFDAATIDEEALGAVRAGCLAKELETAAGFGDLGGFTLVPGGADDEDDEDDGITDEGAAQGSGADVAAARAAELERLRHLADRAERAAASSAKDAERAAAEVERIERDLDRARARAEKAAADAGAATVQADAARQALTASQSEDGPGS